MLFSIVLWTGEKKDYLYLLWGQELLRSLFAGLGHPSYMLVAVLITSQMQHPEIGPLFRGKR